MTQTNSTLIDAVFRAAERIKKTTSLHGRWEIRKIFYELNTIKSNYHGLSLINYHLEAYSFPKPHQERSNVSCFSLSKARSLLAVGESDGKVKIYKIATHQLHKSLKVSPSYSFTI